MGAPLYGWKRIIDGAIVQGSVASSKEDLFEAAGFGAVRVNSPIKGFLAVRVRRDETGALVAFYKKPATPQSLDGGEQP